MSSQNRIENPNSRITKVRTFPVHSVNAYRQTNVHLHSFLKSVPRGSGYIHIPAALLPEKNPGNHWLEGPVGPTVSLDVSGEEKNFLLLPGFEPQTIQPVV